MKLEPCIILKKECYISAILSLNTRSFLLKNHNFAWASIFLTFLEIDPEIFLSFY